MSILDSFKARFPSASQPITSLRSTLTRHSPLRLIKWLRFKTARKVDNATSHFKDEVETVGDIHRPTTYNLSELEQAAVDLLRGKPLTERQIAKLAKGGQTDQRMRELNRLREGTRSLDSALPKLDDALADAQTTKLEAKRSRAERHEKKLAALNKTHVQKVLNFPFKPKSRGLMSNLSFSQQVHGVQVGSITVKGLKEYCKSPDSSTSSDEGVLKRAAASMRKAMEEQLSGIDARIAEIKSQKDNLKERVQVSQDEVNQLVAFKSTMKKLKALETNSRVREKYLAQHGETLGLADDDDLGLDDFADDFGVRDSVQKSNKNDDDDDDDNAFFDAIDVLPNSPWVFGENKAENLIEPLTPDLLQESLESDSVKRSGSYEPPEISSLKVKEPVGRDRKESVGSLTESAYGGSTGSIPQQLEESAELEKLRVQQEDNTQLGALRGSDQQTKP